MFRRSVLGTEVKYTKFDKKTNKLYKPAINELRTYVKQVNEEKTKIKKIINKDSLLNNKEKKLENRKEEKVKKIKSKSDEQIKNNRKKINELKKSKINKTYEYYADLNAKIKYDRLKLRENNVKHYDEKHKLIEKYVKVDQSLKKAIKEGKPYKSPF